MDLLFISSNCLIATIAEHSLFWCRKIHAVFALFPSPLGLAILPHLLCCSGLEVPEYVFAPRASNLEQTRQLHNLGLITCSVQDILGEKKQHATQKKKNLGKHL